MLKELIQFEFLKAYNDSLYRAILLVMAVLLCISMFYLHFTYDNVYCNKQNNKANEILDILKSKEDSKEMDLIRYYQKIANSSSWKEIYDSYNHIDQYYLDNDLFEKLETDLNYDHRTNIQYRNHAIFNNINPDSLGGGVLILSFYNSFFKYILVVFLLLMSISIILIEYQKKTVNYLFSLNYRYCDIFIAKIIVNVAVSLIIIFIPLLVALLISSLFCGFSNSKILIETTSYIHNIAFGEYTFIYIYNFLFLLLVKINLINVIINAVVCILWYSVKIRGSMFDL